MANILFKRPFISFIPWEVLDGGWDTTTKSAHFFFSGRTNRSLPDVTAPPPTDLKELLLSYEPNLSDIAFSTSTSLLSVLRPTAVEAGIRSRSLGHYHLFFFWSYHHSVVERNSTPRRNHGCACAIRELKRVCSSQVLYCLFFFPLKSSFCCAIFTWRVCINYMTDNIFLQGRCLCDSHQLICPRGYRCVGELLQVRTNQRTSFSSSIWWLFVPSGFFLDLDPDILRLLVFSVFESELQDVIPICHATIAGTRIVGRLTAGYVVVLIY